MNTTIKFEFDSGVSRIDLKQWVLNRSVGDTNAFVRQFIKPCNNKFEVCPIVIIICKAFRNGNITERPYEFSSNKAVAQKFWRRIEILEDAIKKNREVTI